MAADVPLAGLRADALRRAPELPGLDEVLEDAGRQRLAAYYLYSAQLAGLIGADGLAPASWPPQLGEPMRRMGLTRLAPRTGPGLDAQLTAAERSTRRSPDRQSRFARMLVDLINEGAFGPLCGDADRVRLAGPGQAGDQDLELIKGQQIVGTCRVRDHWELVAQHLAGARPGHQQAETPSTPGSQAVLRQLKETGIAHAVSLGTTLAVQVHPLGAAAGLGTRLIRSRIQADRDEADALRRLAADLRTLAAEADGELRSLNT